MSSYLSLTGGGFKGIIKDFFSYFTFSKYYFFSEQLLTELPANVRHKKTLKKHFLANLYPIIANVSFPHIWFLIPRPQSH